MIHFEKNNKKSFEYLKNGFNIHENEEEKIKANNYEFGTAICDLLLSNSIAFSAMKGELSDPWYFLNFFFFLF